MNTISHSIKIALYAIVILVISMFLLAFITQEAYAAEEVASGTCGDDLTWVLDDEGTLIISGSGAMSNYSGNSRAPWTNDVTSIHKVIIRDGVTSIGNSAFRSCKSLTSITIPNGVTSIGSFALDNCSSLTSITIPDSVTSIDHDAFVGCGLTSITIPNSITSISNFTFFGCRSLTSVTIPDSVTSIGSFAFYACSSLTSITIPNGVTSISNYTFYECSSLTSITIPDSVTSIGANAFWRCSKLKTIIIPISVKTIESGAFKEDSLCYVFYEGTEEEWSALGVDSIGNDKVHYNSTGDHTWDNGEVTTEPTCTIEGEKTFTCTVCGETKMENVDALGHALIHYDGKDATCTEAGWKEYDACSRCDYTTYEAVGKLGHDLIHHEGKAATCTKDGWNAYDTCSRCDYTTYEAVGKLGHDLKHHEAKAATCTEDGWKEYDTCSRCDYTTYEAVGKLGHDLKHHEAKAATCTEDGWNAYDECSRCDYTTYEAVGKLGHDLIHHDAKAATCTEDGWKAYDTCSRCDYTTYEAVSKLGHTWNDSYTVDKAATYDEEGSESIHCSVCGAIQEGSARSIPQLDRSEQKGEDGTPVGKGASDEAAEKEITNLPNDNDPKGTVFRKLMLKSTKQAKNSITLSWKGVSGATSYVIYGNVCGKTKKLKKLKETGGKTYTVKEIAGKGLKKSTFHKFMVVALDSSNHVVSTSKIIHVTTKTKANYTSVSTKAKKNKVTIKKGKTFKLGAKAVGKKVPKHFRMRYESSDPSIATVSTTGTIKGVKRGKCKVYVYAQNGVYKIISVTIK